MSFCTSFSSKRRPISRFTAKMVFFALVIACRFAGAPTTISPSSRYATTDGVVRAPSEFSITFGWPPSMMATQLLVVPRSMPMILPMFISSGSRDSFNAVSNGDFGLQINLKWGASARQSEAFGRTTATIAGRSTRSFST